MVRELTSIIAVLGVTVLAGPQQQQLPRYTEHVDVGRVLVEVHVVNDSGLPVQDLTVEDFQVRVDGRPARVEHARWIASEGTQGGAASGLSPSPWTESSGRLIVLVFQRSMEVSRLGGLLQMQRKAERFIDRLGPRDRIAIVWFDSHLKLAADFTSDRARLSTVARQSVPWATPPRLEAGPAPSLAAAFDYPAAARAASIEQGLLVLGRALGQIPGPKAVILFGWGFGQLSGMNDFTRAGRITGEDYAQARAALVTARTSVFSIDTTDAATHTMETGLRVLSEETGGEYVTTVDFADAAFDRVVHILSAQYELLIAKPDLPRGNHTIEVTVPRRDVTVFARKSYSD